MERAFIFEDAPFPSCHAATIAALPDGALVAAWFGGAREGYPDVSIWMAHRSPGATEWSAPRLVADVEGVPCWNPVLHQTAGGELLLFFKAGSHPQTWSGLLQRSVDGGKTWSGADLLPAGILGPIKNKPLELADGTLVCGSSVESYKAWGCWVERTSDGARSWSKHGPINVAGHLHGAIQPAVFAGHADEAVVMLCRSRGLGRIVRATSTDGGRTWSDLSPIDVPHNNSGIDATRAPGGRTVLVYNHTTKGRSPLNVAASDDLGLTFTASLVLEDAPGEFSYPAVVTAADGRLHIAYTWNRRRVCHVALDAGELVSARG